MTRTFLLLLSLTACAAEGVAPSSIEKLSTYQDPGLLARAWQLPVASTLRGQHVSQENGSLCGPSTVANLRRSLALPEKSQKQLILGGFWQLLGIQFMGLTLDEQATLTRQETGRQVTVLRGLSLDELRTHLRQSNDLGKRYSVNFSRQPLFGRGGGHHSPIGGYLVEEDLVFVLDTNAAYKPFLVASERLHAGIDTMDGELRRGLLLIE